MNFIGDIGPSKKKSGKMRTEMAIWIGEALRFEKVQNVIEFER
jgi:hypothetical protein